MSIEGRLLEASEAQLRCPQGHQTGCLSILYLDDTSDPLDDAPYLDLSEAMDMVYCHTCRGDYRVGSLEAPPDDF